MDYKQLCEHIYRSWRDNREEDSVFASDFDIDYLPEPYYPIREGRKSLYVLNNNPGGVLPFQHRSHIKTTFNSSTDYDKISTWLMDQYISLETEIGGSANARNNKIIEIAETLGFDGIENVETFFLHSSNFPKGKFLKKHSKRDIVTRYLDALTRYLENKTVLTIACVGSRVPLDIDVVRNSEWLRLQAHIAGMDLDLAEFRPVTIKNGKATSGIVKCDSKIMVCSMGSNNIPLRASEVLAEWV